MKISEILFESNEMSNMSKLMDMSVTSVYKNTLEELKELTTESRRTLLQRNPTLLKEIDEEINACIRHFEITLAAYERFHQEIGDLNNLEIQQRLKEISQMRAIISQKRKQIVTLKIKEDFESNTPGENTLD